MAMREPRTPRELHAARRRTQMVNTVLLVLVGLPLAAIVAFMIILWMVAQTVR